MPFMTGDFPPVDPETFQQRSHWERIRITSTQWVEYGFGTPKMVHTIYIAKLLLLYIGLGMFIITATSGVGPFWDVSAWWREPVVHQKAIIWTVLLEILGVAGSWGPLAAHFKPMTGGFHYWARPGTLRMPPWGSKVPFTGGDERTVGDVVLYLAILGSLIAGLFLPTVASTSLDAIKQVNAGLVNPAVLLTIVGLILLMGLRDKVVFLGARSEQYLPALVFAAVLPAVDMIIAWKLLIVVVWVGAGASKFGKHFSKVVSPMVSNTPWLASKRLKRRNVKDFPNDLHPSRSTDLLAHVGGTTVEIFVPLVLLFSTNPTITLLAAVGMIAFHLFILSTFPLAVPLEWNVLFAFATAFLFLGFPNSEGFAVMDFSSVPVLLLITAALLFFPVLGNLRPDLVSFLPSMRQYAGNWASATWAFAPGAEDKLNALPRAAKNTIDQIEESGYSREESEVLLQMTIGWRSMHSQGPALFSMLSSHLGESIHEYTLREAEFCCNTILGFNFGDGHFHDERLIAAIQKRCHFEPGEFLVAWVESQPIHKDHQEYRIIDAALGVIERGTYRVADSVSQQGWLPDGPIPLNVTWSLQAPSPAVDTVVDSNS